MARVKSYRWAGAVVAALGLFAASSAGQPPRPAQPDPVLDLARAKQQVAEQKAERDIAEVLKAAEQQWRISPPKAAQILKSAKADLQFASIGEAARTRLTNALDARLATIEGKPAVAPVVAAPGTGLKLDPKSAEVIAAQKAAQEKAAAEYKDVLAGLATVTKAQEAGESAAANKEIARLTKQYPDNPSVIALGQSGSMKTRLGDAIAFQEEQRMRWNAIQKGINESSLPPIRDMEFPKDWKERTKYRNQTQQLTAKEKKIIEALDKPITVDFKERPFEEALQDLANKLDLPLLIDKKSLEDLSIDLKKGATLEARGLAGRTVLRSMLAAQGLTFVVKDETVQVVTVERARTQLATRVYYLGDLVQGVGPFGDIRWGPGLNLLQLQENVQVLVNTIQKSIDPLSWREAGGPGSVTFHAPSMSIIVRASAEVHYTLGRTFGGK